MSLDREMIHHEFKNELEQEKKKKGQRTEADIKEMQMENLNRVELKKKK